MVRRVWAGRWARAGAVAVLVALWPACVMQPHEEPVASSDGPDVEYADLDFTMKDMHGEDVRLADFKGRPLLINFWATWCAPCKHEIPGFVELVDKYRAEQLTVLGISVDDSPEDLRPFAEDFKINYPVLVGLGRQDVMDAYMAGLVMPETWFIRPDGSVYLKYQGTNTKAWFEEQIQALLPPAAPGEAGTR
jgi:cytochrome c biogenesis protein CcmG/thiol:disulfide interchange protein DsbE